MKFIISNVNSENKFKGAYSKIFEILNADRLFCEVYESEDSKGLIGNEYHLKISETPDFNLVEKILKIKNVKISN